MVSHITPERIANSILQDNSFSGAYCLVEGVNDYLFHSKFIEKTSCEIKISHGAGNVIDTITILKGRGFKMVIGIIDSDFRTLDNESVTEPEVFSSDDHDLELMSVKSSAFDVIVLKYCKPEKTEQVLKASGGDLRRYFLTLARPLGYLKWVNKRQKLGLAFKPSNVDGKPLPFQDFISTSTLAFAGEKEMISTVINYSRNKTNVNTSVDEAFGHIKKIENDQIDLYQLCNGHDVCMIFSLSLRKKLSNLNASDCKPELIEKDLILAFDSRDFVKTKLYQNVKAWATAAGISIWKF